MIKDLAVFAKKTGVKYFMISYTDLLKGNVQNINIGTFHSICAKILSIIVESCQQK